MPRVCGKFSAPAPSFITVIANGGTVSLPKRMRSREILLIAAKDSTPRYEKYSHAARADVYRVHLSPGMAASVLKQVMDASPRALRKKLAALQPPAALLFFIPRTNFAGAAVPP